MKRYKYILAGLILSAVVQSCDVERFPMDSIEQSQSFNKVTDAEKWDNNFYAQLRGRIYGTFTQATDVQSDMLNATIEFGNVFGAPHKWSNDFNSDNYEVRDVWQGYYAALKNINLSIEKFPTIIATTDADKAKMNQYLGDAHLMRAYYYLNLVLRYSKAYDAATADSDLGVPLISKFDLKEVPKRATMKETYSFILNDIAQAKTLLAGVVGAAGSRKFTIDAAWALEARVKLYMGDLTGAKVAAEEVINGAKYKLYNTSAGVKSIWETDATQETILQLFCNLTERPNQNSAYYGYEASTKTYRPNFVPSQWVIDTYATNDFRKAAYFKDVTIYKAGINHVGTIVNKYPGNTTLVTSLAENHNAPKVFRIAELYLISAEASVVSDPANALLRLNELRVSRGLAALSGLSGTALMDEVKAERLRELAFEGFRLDDLKRWKQGFTRRSPQSTAFLETGEGFIALSVTATNDKFVWGVPSYEITLNSKLVQNQGW